MDSISLILKIKKNTLPESERKVAEYILTNQKEVISQTIMVSANKAGTSTAAITRLCKSLGLKNFSELKILLAKDVFISEVDINPSIDMKSDESELISTINKNIINSIIDLEKILKIDSIKAAIEAINAARYIHAFGDGLSNNIGFDFSYKMLQLGFLAGSCKSIHLQGMFANNMQPCDVGMIITHSGYTKSIVEICKILKKKQVKIILITGSSDSPISRMSDIVLFSPLTEPLYRQGAGSSRIMELIIIDILYALLVKQNYEYYVGKLKETSNLIKDLSL